MADEKLKAILEKLEITLGDIPSLLVDEWATLKQKLNNVGEFNYLLRHVIHDQKAMEKLKAEILAFVQEEQQRPQEIARIKFNLAISKENAEKLKLERTKIEKEIAKEHGDDTTSYSQLFQKIKKQGIEILSFENLLIGGDFDAKLENIKQKKDDLSKTLFLNEKKKGVKKKKPKNPKSDEEKEEQKPTETEVTHDFFSRLEQPFPNKTIVDTHNKPWLDDLKPDLSVFLASDASNCNNEAAKMTYFGSCYPVICLSNCLFVGDFKSHSITANEAKGQCFKYVKLLARTPNRIVAYGFLHNATQWEFFRVSKEEQGKYKYAMTSPYDDVKGFEYFCRLMMQQPKILGLVEPEEVNGSKLFINNFLGSGLTSDVYEVLYQQGTHAYKYFKQSHLKQLKTESSILVQLNKIQTDTVPTLIATSQFGLIISPVGIPIVTWEDSYLDSILFTLKICHGHKIYHRDIRPKNIIIANSRIVLIDWGFAVIGDYPEAYAGAVSTASPNVLDHLSRGGTEYQYSPSDDLVSLVRTIFLIKFPAVAKTLAMLRDQEAYARINKVWEALICNSIWQECHNAAVQYKIPELAPKLKDAIKETKLQDLKLQKFT